MIYFSSLYQLGFGAVFPASTFLAALVMIRAGERFEKKPERDSRLQEVVFGMSIVVLTGVFGSGILQFSLLVLSGPFLGIVASISFFVGKRESFFW
jgi:hypothetical protein